jgi:exosortase
VQVDNARSFLHVSPSNPRSWATLPNLLLAIGVAVLAVPTMLEVARNSWSTEQGGHGPLVLATGAWAVWRELRGTTIRKAPGKSTIWLPLMALTLALFVLARITGVLEIEAYAMYASLIIAAYAFFGAELLRGIWFPLTYLAFTLPPPDTVVAFVTQPIKIAISSASVSLLYLLGYPVASSGVTIQIGQYELLVAAACAGLNSIVTLTALCLFYVYLRHRSNLGALLVIAIAALPIAIISNFVRVVALVLITYYFGDAAAQGFVHDFAGLLMFSVALFAIFAVDQLATVLLYRRLKSAR